jgi:GNAT superfamily N-acetyltransferase
VGSALLRAVLERCDRDGTPAYLEASCERNRQLYLRHGFTDLEPLPLPDGGPVMYPMWREPAGSRPPGA